MKKKLLALLTLISILLTGCNIDLNKEITFKKSNTKVEQKDDRELQEEQEQQEDREENKSTKEQLEAERKKNAISWDLGRYNGYNIITGIFKNEKEIVQYGRSVGDVDSDTDMEVRGFIRTSTDLKDTVFVYGFDGFEEITEFESKNKNKDLMSKFGISSCSNLDEECYEANKGIFKVIYDTSAIEVDDEEKPFYDGDEIIGLGKLLNHLGIDLDKIDKDKFVINLEGENYKVYEFDYENDNYLIYVVKTTPREYSGAENYPKLEYEPTRDRDSSKVTLKFLDNEDNESSIGFTYSYNPETNNEMWMRFDVSSFGGAINGSFMLHDSDYSYSPSYESRKSRDILKRVFDLEETAPIFGFNKDNCDFIYEQRLKYLELIKEAHKGNEKLYVDSVNSYLGEEKFTAKDIVYSDDIHVSDDDLRDKIYVIRQAN